MTISPKKTVPEGRSMLKPAWGRYSAIPEAKLNALQGALSFFFNWQKPDLLQRCTAESKSPPYSRTTGLLLNKSVGVQ
jgi:hypothetical protein